MYDIIEVSTSPQNRPLRRVVERLPDISAARLRADDIWRTNNVPERAPCSVVVFDRSTAQEVYKAS